MRGALEQIGLDGAPQHVAGAGEQLAVFKPQRPALGVALDVDASQLLNIAKSTCRACWSGLRDLPLAVQRLGVVATGAVVGCISASVGEREAKHTECGMNNQPNAVCLRHELQYSIGGTGPRTVERFGPGRRARAVRPLGVPYTTLWKMRSGETKTQALKRCERFMSTFPAPALANSAQGAMESVAAAAGQGVMQAPCQWCGMST